MVQNRITSTLLIALAAVVGAHFLADPPAKAPPKNNDPWATMEPSHTLDWQRCFPNSTVARKGHPVTCARLVVPLDHDDAHDNRTMELPIIRISPPSEAERTVFWNIGGPGLNAVDQLPNMFKIVSEYVGNDTAVIAVAPRGTAGVTPEVKCFPKGHEDETGGPDEATLWDEFLRNGFLDNDLSDASLMEAWAVGRAYGMNCKAGAPSLLPYVGTYHTAKDMDYVRQALNMKELSYLGHSYGTILGVTYANLFPDRVGQMVLDGVANYNWYKTFHVPGETVSGPEDVLEMFFKACWRAGSDKCALWDEDADKIRERFNEVGPTLRKRPFIARIEEEDKSRYVAVSEWSWNNYVHLGIHFISGFSQLAHMAVDILDNKNTTKQNSTYTFGNHLRRLLDDLPPPDQLSPGESAISDATTLIHCADRGGLNNDLTPEEIRSRLLGDPENDSIILQPQVFNFICAAANFPTKGRPKEFANIKTSGRILFVGNTADPVTPIYNARKFHDAFTNSGLLTIDGAGHCASKADPKRHCIREYIQPYFQYGEMPPEGTVCKGFKELMDAKGMEE